MRYFDALKIIKNMKTEDQSEQEALKLAMEALTKIDPVEPYRGEGDECYCPTCHEIIEEGYPLCDFCGQRFDWRG